VVLSINWDSSLTGIGSQVSQGKDKDELVFVRIVVESVEKRGKVLAERKTKRLVGPSPEMICAREQRLNFFIRVRALTTNQPPTRHYK
jgi:hypothetical protein